jgi:hypothetical protein
MIKVTSQATGPALEPPHPNPTIKTKMIKIGAAASK